jgi:putative transposase
LEQRIKEICETRVRFGYRRVHVLLRREGWEINAKKTYRVYKALSQRLRPCDTIVPNLCRGPDAASEQVAMINFKGAQFPKDVILFAVWFYVRFPVSYRDLEEIMEERGVNVDHATLNRWVERYAPLIAQEAQKRKTRTGRSWRMDETYIKVKGRWCYLYRAIDKHGKTLDFMLSEARDEAAATTFFARTIGNNGWPDRVVIDKSGANAAGLENMNLLLLLSGWCWLIEVLQVKYLNNIIEQDHRFIKRITRQMKGFKSFAAAQATLAGIETAHMIRKGQLNGQGGTAFEQFKALAG